MILLKRHSHPCLRSQLFNAHAQERAGVLCAMSEWSKNCSVFVPPIYILRPRESYGNEGAAWLASKYTMVDLEVLDRDLV